MIEVGLGVPIAGIVVAALLALWVWSSGRRAEARVLRARERQARREADAVQHRQAFLADASRRLAHSLDYVTTLREVKALGVPILGDTCDVYLSDAADAATPPAEVQQALATGQSQLVDAPPTLVVPLVARDQTLGALCLARSAPGPHYTPEDRSLAEDLADRCALAIDNARLYEAAQEEIAERQQVVAALRDSQQRYRHLVDNANDIVYRTDATGHFTYVNPVVQRLLGFPPDEIIGRHYLDLVAPAQRRAVGRFYARQLAESFPATNYEFKVVAKDGSEHWLDQNVQLVVRDDRVVGVQAIARDVTERKQAELDLATLTRIIDRERARLSAIVSSMSDGLIMLDDEGRIGYCNSQAARAFGVQPDQLLQKTALDAFRQIQDALENAPAFWSDWEKALAEVGQHPKFEASVAGSPRMNLQVQLFPVSARAGEHLGVGILIRDVTAERELARAKDDLVAMVSHELASPATNLVGYAELLADGAYSEVERKQMLETMVEEGRRLTTIIRDFLEIRRLERRGLALAPRPTDLGGLLEHAARVAMADVEHRFVLELPVALPPVKADPDRIQQVVANLVSNAQKYTPSGGRVRLSARVLDDAVEVSVEDEGLGVPLEAQPYLFEKFYRVEHADRGQIQGTGLGLAIAKDIVEGHGGMIGADSKGPGHGSRFWFTVPLASHRPSSLPGGITGSDVAQAQTARAALNR